MVGVEGAHGLLSVEIGKILIELLQTTEVAIEVIRILNQRLKIKNGDQFLTCAKPKQVDSHQGVVEVVIRIGHRVQNLELFTCIQPGYTPAPEIWNLPEPAANHTGSLAGTAFLQSLRNLNGFAASCFDALVKFVEKWVKHGSAPLNLRVFGQLGFSWLTKVR